MGQVTPNIGIYIPAAGETNYDSSFAAGMVNVDQHDHSGGPTKGVPLSSGGIQDGSITRAKLNANVVLAGGGLAVDGGSPNALKVDGVLAGLFGLATNGIIVKTGATTAATRTLVGTTNNIAITANADGVSGNPTIAFAPITINSSQPGFLAYKNMDSVNATGNGAVFTIIGDVQVTDKGNNYDPVTGIFTAPAGASSLYDMKCSVTFSSIGAATQGLVDLVTSNRVYRQVLGAVGVESGADTLTSTIAHVADIDAADTAFWECVVSGLAGDTVTVRGLDTAIVLTAISGQLWV